MGRLIALPVMVLVRVLAFAHRVVVFIGSVVLGFWIVTLTPRTEPRAIPAVIGLAPAVIGLAAA